MHAQQQQQQQQQHQQQQQQIVSVFCQNRYLSFQLSDNYYITQTLSLF
jgi:hypothetical protein